MLCSHALAIAQHASRTANGSLPAPQRSSCSPAGGEVAWAWEGYNTTLPANFAALRIETNYVWLICSRVADPLGGIGHEVPWNGNPVQLLCRALQLAPEWYQFFELAAAVPEEALNIGCGEAPSDSDESDSDGEDDWVQASFEDIPALAAAMRQYAVAEHLRVDVSPDERTIVITRLGKCSA